MYRVVTPQTAAELESYYQLRWELLRKPFNLPIGSERDEYDTVAIHRLMLAEDGTPIFSLMGMPRDQRVVRS